MSKIFFDPNKLPPDGEELASSLASSGWREIETHHNGRTRVLFRPRPPAGEPSAVRINISGDIGFYNYATLSMARPSPHFQKVFGHGILRDGITHVTMSERLHPAPSVLRAKEPVRSQLQAFWALANSHFPYANDDGRKFSLTQEEDGATYLRDASLEKLRTLKENLKTQSESLANAVALLIQCQAWLCRTDARFSDFYPDFMPANIMLRKNSKAETIVLSDPFACDPQQTEFYRPGKQERIMEQAFGKAPENVTRLFRFEF